MSDILTDPAVRQWMSSVGMSSGDERLAILAAFCEHAGATPGELVDRCLADAGDGQKKIRMKQRRLVNDQIEEFQGRPDGRRQSNVVRSFFVHNGVSMQPGSILR